MRRRASALMLPAVIGAAIFLSVPTTAAAHGGNNNPLLVHAYLGRTATPGWSPNQQCLRIEVAVHWVRRSGPDRKARGRKGPPGRPGRSGRWDRWLTGPAGEPGPPGRGASRGRPAPSVRLGRRASPGPPEGRGRKGLRANRETLGNEANGASPAKRGRRTSAALHGFREFQFAPSPRSSSCPMA